MNYAKRIVRAFGDGKIDQRVLDLWAKNTNGENPVARAKSYLKARRITWIIISLVAFSLFMTLGWPFSNQSYWIKATMITSTVTGLLMMMSWPFLGYRSPSVKLLYTFTCTNDDNSCNMWLRTLDDLKAEKSRLEVIYSGNEQDKLRPNWRMGKKRIRRRSHRKRRVHSKMC